MKILKYFIIYVLIIFFILELFSQVFIRYFNYKNDWESRYDIWKTDSVLGWYTRSNIRYLIKGFDFVSHFSTDENGFRKNKSKAFNDTSIILIGDSFVQACEVNDDEVFSNLIQYKKKNTIINAGVRGYGIDQSYLLLKRVINEKTKTIVLFVCDNDFRDIISDNNNTNYPLKPKFEYINDSLILHLPKYEKDNNDIKESDTVYYPTHFTYRVSSFIKNVIYKSAVCRIIVNAIQFSKIGKWLYEKNLIEKPIYMQYDWKLVDNDIMDKAYIVFDKLLDKYIALANEYNAEFIVFLIPSSFLYEKKLISQINSLKKLYDFDFYMEQVYDSVYNIIIGKNVKCIYPIEQFYKYGYNGELTFKFDKHWNSRGHKLVADILLEELK